MSLIGKIVFEDEWISIEVVEEKPKTFVFEVYSKCSDCRLGVTHWFPSWRAYTFEAETAYKTELSDRCQIAIGSFTMWLNAQHKMKYKHLVDVNSLSNDNKKEE